MYQQRFEIDIITTLTIETKSIKQSIKDPIEVLSKNLHFTIQFPVYVPIKTIYKSLKRGISNLEVIVIYSYEKVVSEWMSLITV